MDTGFRRYDGISWGMPRSRPRFGGGGGMTGNGNGRPHYERGEMKLPADLSKARILVTNDDGINAPGIAVLERVARSLSEDVWVVAPAVEQSAASHSLTIHTPLRIYKRDERHFQVNGTPTDCVLMAIAHIMKDNPPDLILSGVNSGGNIADDVTYSGTIAAAMEGTILKVPAIALSLEYSPAGDKMHWETPEAWAAEVIRKVIRFDWPGNVLMNVNFPAVPPEQVTGIRAVFQGERKILEDLYERIDPRGRPYYWIGPLKSRPDVAKGSDITALEDHAISVTPLRLNLTDWPSLERLEQVLGSTVEAAE
jgi:5'-nucleotidase